MCLIGNLKCMVNRDYLLHSLSCFPLFNLIKCWDNVIPMVTLLSSVDVE